MPLVKELQSQLETFKDVKIVDLRFGIPIFQEPELELYDAHFVLSCVPPDEWTHIFELFWDTLHHDVDWKHRPSIVRDSIAVYKCAPKSLDKQHRDELEAAVKNTNSKYRIYLRGSIREKLAEEEGNDDLEKNRLEIQNAARKRMGF